MLFCFIGLKYYSFLEQSFYTALHNVYEGAAEKMGFGSILYDLMFVKIR